MRNNSPTKRHARTALRKTAAQIDVAIAKPRRVKVEPPEIYVRIPSQFGMHQYAQAHLRQKGKYLYLSWRENKRIKTFYLGKRKQSSPTVAIAGARGPEMRSQPGA